MTQRRLQFIEDQAASGQRVFAHAELRDIGVPAHLARQHVEAERWRRLPYRGVVIDCGPLDVSNRWRASLLEVSGGARLGGATALQAAGLAGLSDTAVHVWVTKSTRKGTTRTGMPRWPTGVVVHESRRWGQEDAITTGIPRARPTVASVQAALWSRTVREAALMLVMPVQQRLVRVDEVIEEFERVRRHEFRRPLRAVLEDIRAGSHSMNELDFVRMCHEFGVPVPDRQVVRRGQGGLMCVDCRWPKHGVSLEIQGAGHGELLNRLSDDVRLLDISADGDVALSVSVLTLRLDPAAYLTRLASLLRSRQPNS